jgi:carboxypeptidase Q
MRGPGFRSQPSAGGLPRGLAVAAALSLVTVASLAWAQAPPEATRAEAVALDQKLLAAAKKDSEIMTNLTYLSDMIGPRLTGSAALERANRWAAERMESYGLSNVHQEAWSIPVGWERGPASGRIVEPDNGRTLTLAAMGWTPGTSGKIEGDVVVLNVRTAKDLASYKGKLKNAIVLRGAPSPVRPITDLTFFPTGRADRPPEAGTPADKKPDAEKKPDVEKKPDTEKKPEADKKPEPGGDTPPERRAFPDRGNFAQMTALRREMADFLRSEGAAVMLHDAAKPQGLLTMAGGWRGNDRASGPEPMAAAFVPHEQYALLYRLATRPAPARTRVEIEISNKLAPGPLVVHNTVGEIRGSDKPDEFVVLGAHLDSWDLGQGTTDNGTGSAVVLEAARMLVKSGIKPRRTIRFVLFTGEEQGLYGSKAYVQQHKDELPRTSMCLVHDTGTGKVTGLGLQRRAAVKPILETELASLKDLGMKDINLRAMNGSDHASFEEAGVPGFAVQQDMSEYRFTHHSQSDTLDKVHEADLVQGAQVMAVTALRVANLPNLLPRDKPPRERPPGAGEE